MSEQPPPDRTVALPPPQAGPEAGPAPAAVSVLHALGAVLPDLPRVQLREADSGARSPIVRPRSEQMPAPDSAGRYQLLGEIARGGMGAVLKGRDTDLGRDIAVKVLLEGHLGKPELTLRFVEEAQISGQLQHPGVVPIYEMGVFADGRPYFTMKLVKGQTLAKLLDERKEPQQNRAPLLKVFEQVCQTLAYAHARGVIHRDVKPSNVMVGHFGEVLVMDWGLAKVLAEGGVADENRAKQRAEVSVIRTLRGESSDVSGSSGTQTQAGSVLGTPAYMAPEQARGDLELTDERADVFGLGAVLCEILTGQPPFLGKTAEAQRKSQMAKLDDAYARLDGCGADAELVALARHCLAAEPWDRPRNAGEVAAALTTYQQSVAQRLRQAELERAAAESRAVEEARTRQMAEAKAAAERKRRQATLALAAAVLALVALGGGAAAWWWLERVTQAQEVEAALVEAETKQQAGRWSQARAALERAEGRLAGGGPDSLRVRLQQARRDAEMVTELDAIRLQRSDTRGGHFDFALAEPSYEAAFARYGLSPAMPAAAAAARVRESGIREALLAGLEDWCRIRKPLGFDFADGELRIGSLTPGGALAEDGRVKVGDRIAGVGQGPEGPVQDVRGKTPREVNRLIGGRVGSVVRLEVVPAGGQASATYAFTRGGAVGTWLQEVVQAADDSAWRRQFREAMAAKDTAKMQALAQQEQAWAQPPSVLDWLATALQEAGLEEQAERFWREAQQHYPGDFWLNYDLATFLTLKARPPRPQEALGYCRAAVAIRPVAVAHNALGNTLRALGDLEGAQAAFRHAISLDPSSAPAHSNLGLVLHQQHDVDGAMDQFRQALRLEPKFAPAHSNLGHALTDKGDLDGAITEFREAVALDPIAAVARTNLGIALSSKGDLEGAITQLRQAIQLDPKYDLARGNLDVVLKMQELDRKLPAALRGEWKPEPAVRADLASFCAQPWKRLYATAARWYAEAFQARPELAEDLPAAHRYNAACAAVLAGCGQGKDEPPPDDRARARLRRQALDWLRADLAAYAMRLQSGKAEDRGWVEQRLRGARQDSDLVRVRDPAALAKLPDPEQQQWRALWVEVENLLKKAQAGP
jgi:serine/threonine-protein kinase